MKEVRAGEGERRAKGTAQSKAGRWGLPAMYLSVFAQGATREESKT